MLINEILSELTFAGSRCTKDCSGHKAGWRWAMRKGIYNCNGNSQSFNNGCKIASQIKKQPKIRNDRGQFAQHPKLR